MALIASNVGSTFSALQDSLALLKLPGSKSSYSATSPVGNWWKPVVLSKIQPA